MGKPNNILNQKANADRKLDLRIKQGVVIVVSFTLFYLYAESGINEKSDLEAEKTVSILEFVTVNLSQLEFLYILLFLNVAVVLRLVYRVVISAKYNTHYDVAERSVPRTEVVTEEKRREKVDQKYKENSKCLRLIDKHIIGLGFPFAIGFLTMCWLILGLVS